MPLKQQQHGEHGIHALEPTLMGAETVAHRERWLALPDDPRDQLLGMFDIRMTLH